MDASIGGCIDRWILRVGGANRVGAAVKQGVE